MRRELAAGVFGAALLALTPGSARADEFRVQLVPGEQVEARLREYGGTNREWLRSGGHLAAAATDKIDDSRTAGE